MTLTVNRHPDYTMLMEFDAWKSAPLRRTGAATFEGEASVQAGASTLDVISVHRHQEGGTTLTISSPERRLR